MGRPGNIFRKRNQNVNNPIENYGIESSETLIAEVKSRMEMLNKTPAAQNITQYAREGAIQLQQEIKEMNFKEQHQKIIDFRKELEHMRGLAELGLQYTKPKSEYMKKYELLCSREAVPKRNIDKIFLPYLIERKAMGLISKDEQNELDIILGNTKKSEDLSNATTIESYTSDYDMALIMLTAIGVIEFDEKHEILGYDNGKKGKDKMGLPDCTIEAQAYLLAKQNGIAVDDYSFAIKELAKKHAAMGEPILPVKAVRNALNTGITLDNVQKAAQVERNERNHRDNSEGEKIIDD